MDKQAEIHKLEVEKEKVDSQLNSLKGSRIVAIGKRWGKKLFHTMHSHSFSNWKKHYVVTKRDNYRTLQFEQGMHRDAMLRANNLRTRLR